MRWPLCTRMSRRCRALRRKKSVVCVRRTAPTTRPAQCAPPATHTCTKRIAQEKERGLRETYGADDKTCGYFALHATADVYHARVWRKQLEKRIAAHPEAA